MTDKLRLLQRLQWLFCQKHLGLAYKSTYLILSYLTAYSNNQIFSNNIEGELPIRSFAVAEIQTLYTFHWK